jgi:uncharacterized protein (TIGR00369 family)
MALEREAVLPPVVAAQAVAPAVAAQRQKAELYETLGVEIVAAADGRAVIEMTSGVGFRNSRGNLHGGTVLALMDIVASCAVRSALGVDDSLTTISVTANFARPAALPARAVGRVVSLGSRVASVEVEVESAGEVAAHGVATARVFLKPRAFSVPGACDAHVHVYGPQQRFPYIADRRYTPPDAPLEAYREVMRSLGVERAVLSAPSVHGLDNAALLHALAAGGDAFRGIVMVTPDVDDETLKQYHEAGVRGIRTQLKRDGGTPVGIDELRALAGRVASLGWHVEIHVDVGEITDIDRLCTGFPTPVVIEHLGHMLTTRGLSAPGFQALLRHLRDGGWVKLSGPYISSVQPPPHDDGVPFVHAVVEAAPERAVWGSNWPHPHQDPLPDDCLLARELQKWVDGPALLSAVLAENPARLYDFDNRP